MGFQQLPTASNTFHAPMCSDFLSEASGATSSAGACNEAAMHRDRGDCVPSRWTCHEFATIRYSWIILGSGAWYKWITLNYNEYSLSTCNWHQLAISIKVLHALSCLSNCMEHTRWFLLPPCRTSGVASTKKRLGLKWSVCPPPKCRNMSKHVQTAYSLGCWHQRHLLWKQRFGMQKHGVWFLLHVSIIAILWKMSRKCHGRQMSWPTLQTAKRGSCHWPEGVQTLQGYIDTIIVHVFIYIIYIYIYYIIYNIYIIIYIIIHLVRLTTSDTQLPSICQDTSRADSPAPKALGQSLDVSSIAKHIQTSSFDTSSAYVDIFCTCNLHVHILSYIIIHVQQHPSAASA